MAHGSVKRSFDHCFVRESFTPIQLFPPHFIVFRVGFVGHPFMWEHCSVVQILPLLCIPLYCLSIHIATRVFLHEGMTVLSFYSYEWSQTINRELCRSSGRIVGPFYTRIRRIQTLRNDQIRSAMNNVL
jgi:hypothetical protein